MQTFSLSLVGEEIKELKRFPTFVMISWNSVLTKYAAPFSARFVISRLTVGTSYDVVGQTTTHFAQWDFWCNLTLLAISQCQWGQPQPWMCSSWPTFIPDSDAMKLMVVRMAINVYPQLLPAPTANASRAWLWSSERTVWRSNVVLMNPPFHLSPLLHRNTFQFPSRYLLNNNEQFLIRTKYFWVFSLE